MLITKLNKELESLIEQLAVRILQKKVCWSVYRIEDPEDEFLSRPEAPEKNDEILETISVIKVVQESAREVLAKKLRHVNKPSVSQEIIHVISNRVIAIFNNSQTLRDQKDGDKKKEVLPLRFAHAINLTIREKEWRMQSIRRDIYSILDTYDISSDDAEKHEIYQRIQSLLSFIQSTEQEIRSIKEKYDFSVLDTYEEALNMTEAWWDYEGDNAPGSNEWGLDMLDDDDIESVAIFEEDLPYSSAEKKLKKYIPKDLQKEEQYMPDIFHWSSYDEEWHRDDIKIIDYPHIHKDLISTFIRRKVFIFIHASKHINDLKSESSHKKYLIEDLHALSDEIEALQQKLWGIQPDIVWHGDEAIEDDPEMKQKQLEERLYGYLSEYTNAMHIFIWSDREERKRQEWDMLIFENSIQKIYHELSLHCKKYQLESEFLNQDRWDSSRKNSSKNLQEMLQEQDFFEALPQAVRLCVSWTERTLGLFSESRRPVWAPWNLTICIDTLEEWVSDSEKIEVWCRIISMEIRRKINLYFRAYWDTKEQKNDELEILFQELEDEIVELGNALETIHRHSDPDTLPSVLAEEIITLRWKRYKLFNEYLLAQEKWSTKGKIFSITREIEHLSSIIAKKQEQFWDCNTTDHIKDTIPLPRLSKHEKLLSVYIPDKDREREEYLFWDVAEITRKITWTPIMQRHIKEKYALEHQSERQLFIYFHAQERLQDIELYLQDKNISDEQRGKFLIERSYISECMKSLLKELTRNSRLIYEKKWPTEEENARDVLFMEKVRLAGMYFWEIDGILAHKETQKLLHYWSVMQNFISQFREDIGKRLFLWNFINIDTEMSVYKQQFQGLQDRILSAMKESWQYESEIQHLREKTQEIHSSLFEDEEI